MRQNVIDALEARAEIRDWTLRRVQTNEVQLYATPRGVEAERRVQHEQYEVDVLRETRSADGERRCGTASTTLLPNDDIDAALDDVVLMAGLIHNPPHGIPEPADMPEVALVDPRLRNEPEAALRTLYNTLRTTVERHTGVRLAAAEFFADVETTRLTNSRGLDTQQVGTRLHLEWTLIAEHNERRSEFYTEVTRRRLADLDLEADVVRHAIYVRDLLDAGPPTHYKGPVVLRGDVLAEFMNCRTLKLHSSAENKYRQIANWEIGESVFPDTAKGDPLTMWANRRLPYGTASNRFDDEGLPAQRVLLVQDNVLQALVASQRYAEYLSIPPTGAFGNVELPAGRVPASDLLAEPHVEIVAFSWFNPDGLTGDFASEVRLGYRVENGRRIPFKGGTLVGNALSGLADVRWSAETAAYGDYQGPTTARFGELTVTEGSRFE